MKRGTPERHAIDAIARAVVSGRRGQGRRADALADAVAACMHNRLEAVGAPGQYLRLQSPLAPQNVALGNSDPENLHELIAIGQRTAELNSDSLDAFVKLLLAQK